MTEQTEKKIRNIEERLETERLLNKFAERFDKFIEEETHNGDYPICFKENYISDLEETFKMIIEGRKPYFDKEEEVIAELIKTFLHDED